MELKRRRVTQACDRCRALKSKVRHSPEGGADRDLCHFQELTETVRWQAARLHSMQSLWLYLQLVRLTWPSDTCVLKNFADLRYVA